VSAPRIRTTIAGPSASTVRCRALVVLAGLDLGTDEVSLGT